MLLIDEAPCILLLLNSYNKEDKERSKPVL